MKKRVGIYLSPILVLLGLGFAIAWMMRPQAPKEIALPWDLSSHFKNIDPEKISTNPSGTTLLAQMGYSGAQSFSLPIDFSSWRALDRKNHFSCIVLLGSSAEYMPLLKDLQFAPDWNLSAVDGWGFVYQREKSESFTIPEPESIGIDWQKRNRAQWLSQYAANLAAIERFDTADRFLKEARKADPDFALPWAVESTIQLRKDQPVEALASAQTALKRDPQFIMARQTEIQALLALNRLHEAFDSVTRLTDSSGDFYSLMLGARIAHLVQAYEREAEWLERAIALSKKHHSPTGGLYILLGQAYAKRGFAPHSIRAFQSALAQPELSDVERTEVKNTLQHIQEENP